MADDKKAPLLSDDGAGVGSYGAAADSNRTSVMSGMVEAHHKQAGGGGGGAVDVTSHAVDVDDDEAIQALIAQTGPDGLDSDEAHRRLVVFGYNELAEDEVNMCVKFLSYFWGPLPIMIWIAMILEMAQALQPGHADHWTDFGVLLALQTLNGTVAFFE